MCCLYSVITKDAESVPVIIATCDNEADAYMVFDDVKNDYDYLKIVSHQETSWRKNIYRKGRKLSPCFGCDNRKIGCHAECDMYIDFHKKRFKYCVMKNNEEEKQNGSNNRSYSSDYSSTHMYTSGNLLRSM